MSWQHLGLIAAVAIPVGVIVAAILWPFGD